METGLRTNGAGVPYTLLLRIEAIDWVSNFWASTMHESHFTLVVLDSGDRFILQNGMVLHDMS